MRRLTRALLVCLVLLGTTAVTSVLFPSAAFAQSTEEKLDKMRKQAMGDYDVLQMGAAKKKLENAIEIAKREGVSGPTVAKIYVMLGIVVHAKEKDRARVKELFVNALREDRSVKVDPAYKTPSLTKIMEEARKEVGPAPKDDETDKPDKDKRVAGFEHEPVNSARATEGLTLEAFVPADMPVYRMWAYYRGFGEDEYRKMEMKPTSETRFAVEIPPGELRSSQIDYYIEAVNRAGDSLAHAGSKEVPLNVTILGSGDVPPPDDGDGKDGKDGEDGKDGGKKPVAKTDKKVYFHLGPGTAAGIVGRSGTDPTTGEEYSVGPSPTARPDTAVTTPGFTGAFAHVMLEGGYIIDQTHQVGLYFRYQFSPTQNFDRVPDSQKTGGSFFTTKSQCLGLGLPGDCLLGVKYRNFFLRNETFRLYASGGLGIGRTRNWIQLKQDVDAGETACEGKETFGQGDDAYCLVADTVRPGWFHFGGGFGVALPLSPNVGLFGDTYFYALVPDFAFNLEGTVGLRVTF